MHKFYRNETAHETDHPAQRTETFAQQEWGRRGSGNLQTKSTRPSVGKGCLCCSCLPSIGKEATGQQTSNAADCVCAPLRAFGGLVWYWRTKITPKRKRCRRCNTRCAVPYCEASQDRISLLSIPTRFAPLPLGADTQLE